MTRDQELLQRIAAGDTEALAALHQAYFTRLGRFLLRVINDEELAAEVVNDVFLVIWQKAHTFAGRSSPSTWIMGIAYRRALKALRGRRQLLPLEEAAVDGPGTEQLAERQDIDRLLARLSPPQRAVVELTYFFGYSYPEIAEILDCPEGTIKTRMFHARRLLHGWATEDMQ